MLKIPKITFFKKSYMVKEFFKKNIEILYVFTYNNIQI
jgi:hypothetical protein